MKKIFSLIAILFILISSPISTNRSFVFADNITEISEVSNKYENEQNELNQNIEEQINSLDLSKLDEMILELTQESNFLKNNTFAEKIKKIINGELSVDVNSFIEYILNMLFDDVVAFLPYVCLIIAISILHSMVNATKNDKNRSINDVIHFVCFSSVVIIIISLVSKLTMLSGSVLTSIKSQMEVIFPVLLTIMTALGGNVAVSVFQPTMAVLSSAVVSIFSKLLLPIFIFILIFTILSNISNNIKFIKFSDFFSSLFKWIIGIVLMLFSAVVSIQGLMAKSIDTISIKTAKYTIKSAVPIIGGFLSDGVGLIMLSSVLIKNAIGVGGLILLFATILIPIIKILVFSFLLKLAGAILEPVADARTSGFVTSISKIIQMLIALIIGVSFMYFLTIGLVMCSTNVL